MAARYDGIALALRRCDARLALALGAVLLVVVPPARADDASPPPVSGEAARDRVIGHRLDGTTADGPYALLFAADGHLVSTDRDGRVEGTWAFRDGKLCTLLPDEEEECRSVEVAGSTGAFTDTDGSRYPFTIAPGETKD